MKHFEIISHDLIIKQYNQVSIQKQTILHWWSSTEQCPDKQDPRICSLLKLIIKNKYKNKNKVNLKILWYPWTSWYVLRMIPWLTPVFVLDGICLFMSGTMTCSRTRRSDLWLHSLFSLDATHLKGATLLCV